MASFARLAYFNRGSSHGPHVYRRLRGNAVAYVALFFALGGTAYAAATVGSAQVVDNSLLSRS